MQPATASLRDTVLRAMADTESGPDELEEDQEPNLNQVFRTNATDIELAPDLPLDVFLTGDKSTTYSSNPNVEGCLALRNCNLLYGESGGRKYTAALPAEFDRCLIKGSIAPMRAFVNIVGHFAPLRTKEESSTISLISFAPVFRDSLHDVAGSLAERLGRSVGAGYLWSIPGCNLYHESNDGLWYTGNQNLDAKTSATLSALAASFSSPVSAHTQHAWHESQDRRDAISRSEIFKEPQETTAVPGLIGTMRNNQQIDLALERDNEQPNIEKRMDMLDIPGFLCSGYTPHSNEVGRVRAVCDHVSIRVLNARCVRMLERCLSACSTVSNEKNEWLLFCMGEMTYCSTKAVLKLRDMLVSLSSVSPNAATVHVNVETHTVLVSVSSGVLLRRDSSGLVISSISEGTDSWPDGKRAVRRPSIASDEGFNYHFSGFFKCIPYVAFDRPPRTLISSVQSVQAVTPPYGAGTSSVSPGHVSKPLVTTPFLEKVMHDTISGSKCNLADLIPGEDLVVCFANFNDTNEDSIMMSDGSVQRSLFAHLAYSSYLLNEDEKIPEAGEYVSMDEHRWWKSYSRRAVPKNLKAGTFIAGGDGRGKVISTTKTEAGKLSVKVLRYSTPVTGDKIATGHGQKGTVKLVKHYDMPWGTDENGNTIQFDIVVSMSSISNRLTTGQYYEMVSGAMAAKEGRRLILAPSTSEPRHTETVLYDGKSGQMLDRLSSASNNAAFEKDSPDEHAETPVTASWGIYRVWQMTQLTWDKQHYTHRTCGPRSIVTQTGRTAGGGIRFGEMEAHSTESSGLVESFRELKCRMDLIDTKFCCRCETFVQMCECGNESYYTVVSVPHSMLVFSYTNLLTTGHVMRFKVSF